MSPARLRPALAGAAALLALSTLSACSGDDEEPRSGSRSVGTSSESGSPAPSEAGDTGAANPAGLTLVDTGAAPRRIVTLDVEEGHTESTAMQMRTTTSVDLMSSQSIELPVSMPTTSKVTRVDDTGITVEIDYGRPKIEAKGESAAMLRQAEQAFALLESATTTVVYTPTGQVVSQETDLGADAPEMVKRILDDINTSGFGIGVPFPEEAVGVGARWTVEGEVTVGEVQSTTTTEFELVELTDDGYVVEITTAQTALAADLPGGMGKVVGGETTSSGTYTGRTGLVGPASATVSSQGSATIEVGGQEVTTTYAVEMDVKTS